MPYSDAFLDELRAAVRLSDFIGRRKRLKKEGAEFILAEDESIGINNAKRRWYDNGSNKRNGDVFGWLTEFEGFSFPEAVEEVAKFAGIVECGHGNGQRHASFKDPSAGEYRDHASGHDTASTVRAEVRRDRNAKAIRRIAATYDYLTAEGALKYQVVRWEPKNFSQRRPPRVDDDPAAIKGNWVWNLDGIEHGLYRFPQLLQDLREERQDQPTVFLAEGERDADTLVAMGFSATTNSGGAKNFSPALAKYFYDAADVVICEDDDDAGRRRTIDIAPMLLNVGARVRRLNIADFHQSKPKDITDWRDKCDGNADKIYEIIDKLPDWGPPPPPPFESKYGVKTFADLTGAATAYPWRIKGLIPMHENVLWMGPSGSGKTFAVLDICMHIVRGLPFAGRKTVPAGVAYLSYEGQGGLENRIRAYAMRKGLGAADLKSFAWWTRPPGLYADEDNVTKLAEEIIEITKDWNPKLGAIIVDTHNSATRGSSEIKSDEISKILTRYEMLRDKTGAPIWLIGHTNSEGKHRGNEQIYNTIDCSILIERLTEGNSKSAEPLRDSQNRPLRRVTIKKQRDGQDGLTWDFVLDPVVLGKDEDGDDITSMISDEPNGGDVNKTSSKRPPAPPGAWTMNSNETQFFKAMLQALGNAGVKPDNVQLMKDGESFAPPRTVGLIVAWKDLWTVYKSMIPLDDNTEEARRERLARIKVSMRRAREKLHDRNVIGIAYSGDGVDQKFYLWPTGRIVVGPGIIWPDQRVAQFTAPEPDPVPIDEATGEPMEDI